MSGDKRASTADTHLLEENLEDLYDHAPCGYISTWPDGTFAKVNQTILDWLGYQREDLIDHRRFQDLLTIAGKIFHETHYAPLLHMQGLVNEIAFDLIGRDRQIIPVIINSIQKRDDAGNPLLNRTTIFNARDRREYERELLLARKRAEQTAQSKARFLSTISHEIRNPLTAIRLAAQRLERSDPDSKQQNAIRILKSSSSSLLALVNDILDYSKIESGEAMLDQRSFDLHELARDICERQASIAEEKQLAVCLEIAADVPALVIGDPLKIGQVLTNLLGNAIKFTETGTVTLALQAQAQLPDRASIDFSVKDTGIGIAPERLEYIFEEFAQATSDTVTKYGGTGLGLAISQKIVQLHGSQIVVTSSPGQGSTFAFMLSLHIPNAAA